ncbi:hypothetical protein RP29_14770 [Acidovorax temperans]|uniref:Uncharacterized protein n=1 Tax=Acidovorax temperans TaxID=80878 RepID=A0A0D7K642_9BURK|nr:hypothetical protein RP29_14770 [Acidovorax temperans]
MSVEDHAIRVQQNQIIEMSDSGNSFRLSGVGSRETDSTTGNNGRYGVFVNHLGHSITQQDHVLIKRFNLSLQFDSVNQIDGNWDMFTTQCVQERILEKLAFIAHDMLRVQNVVVKPHLTTPTDCQQEKRA